MKKILAIILIACMMCITLCACSGEKITEDKAVEIVMEDLGILVNNVTETHIHEGTYENQDCYNIYVTANGKSLTYVVSTTGEILYKGEGSHSH